MATDRRYYLTFAARFFRAGFFRTALVALRLAVKP